MFKNTLKTVRCLKAVKQIAGSLKKHRKEYRILAKKGQQLLNGGNYGRHQDI